MRIAGDNDNYTFVLRNDVTGRYVKDCVIELPSVTTVIKRVLVKHGLLPWSYNQTLNAFVGVANMVYEGELSVEDFIDTFTDPDMAKEWMKENGLRPEDVTTDASRRGTEKHAFLESLGQTGVEDDEAAEYYARKHVDDDDPFVHAICEWWLATNPSAVAVETVLWSTKLGVAGSVDLVWKKDGYLRVTDLKTRKAGSKAYESDFVQVDGYTDLWNERNPERNAYDGSVLLAMDDGCYNEVEVPDNFFGTFEKIKELHDMIRGGE